MTGYLVRALKRLAVLAPGILIAYFSIRNIFPLFDKRLPLAIAIFLTYVLGAYVLIPAGIRLVRVVLPAKHLQAYSVTPDGFASDPVNIGIIGSRQELIAAMQAAGWTQADDHTVAHVAHQAVSVLLKRPYPAAPMSNLYLFGRRQDIGFELPLPGSRGNRHHVRFWATNYQPGNRLDITAIKWHRRQSEIRSGQRLWLGAASRDVGFAFITHNVQITHMIDPDTNAERQLIVDGLTANHRTRSIETMRLAKPYRLANRAWRGQLKSDGQLVIVRLKNT